MPDILSSLPGVFARHRWRFCVSCDVTLPVAAEIRHWTDPYDSLRICGVRDDPDRVIVRFFDMCAAEISRKGHSVRVWPLGPEVAPSTLRHFALDVVLPRVIADSGDLVVHGALVSRGGDGICLVGDSGRGKSTMSAALQNAGWMLHGDDALVLRAEAGGIAAQASYPSLRLFPDSLEQLFPKPPAGLSPVAEYLDKVRLDPGEAAGSCSLRAVLVLDEDAGDGAVALRCLTASRLCMTLVGQGFALEPTDKRAAQRRLTTASAVASAVPGMSLCYPRDYARVPEVVGQIDAMLRRLQDKDRTSVPADLKE